MKTLEEIARQNDKWKDISIKICQDYDIGCDILQLMYLKLSNLNKPITDYYIVLTIRHLYYNYLKIQKTTSINEFHYLQDHTNNFEPSDEQQKILDNLDSLTWLEKELLLEKMTGKSYRELEKMLNINYGFIYKKVKIAKEKLRNTNK